MTQSILLVANSLRPIDCMALEAWRHRHRCSVVYTMIRKTSVRSLHSCLFLEIIYCRKKSQSIAGLTLLM